MDSYFNRERDRVKNADLQDRRKYHYVALKKIELTKTFSSKNKFTYYVAPSWLLQPYAWTVITDRKQFL